MTQLAAEALGLNVDRVEFELGDTRFPRAPEAGGSVLTAALGSAVHNACVALVQRFLALVSDDPNSPLQGCAIENVVAADGRLARGDDESRGESYAEILQRHGLDELTADGDSAPPRAATGVLVGRSGIGEVGIMGVAAASANGVYHATGRRIRSLQITIDQLL